MRLLAGMVALLAAGLPQMVAAQAPPPAPSKDIVVERVTVPELKKMMEADKVLVVDVRSADAYQSGHIPGSISAPLAEIDKHVEKLKSAKKDIVTYCTWAAEATSARAVLKLDTAGIKGARALLGGFSKWQADGNPVTQGDSPR